MSRAQRKVFESPPGLPPHHRAALDVFLTDLVRPYGLALHDVHDGHTYGEMAAELIAATVSADEPVDLLVLAFAIPDMRPGRATATYLSHICPGGPLAFAVCDQGTAAAFTGLRLARDYLRDSAYRRALVLVVEQSVLPYATTAETAVPQRHAGLALLCGRSGPMRLRALDQHPNVTAETAAEILAREIASTGDNPAVFLGDGLAAPTGQPFTGAWWGLAAGQPMDGGGEVLVADYDPLLRYLCLARFTAKSTDPAGV